MIQCLGGRPRKALSRIRSSREAAELVFGLLSGRKRLWIQLISALWVSLLRDSHTAFAPLPHCFPAFEEALSKGVYWLSERLADGSRSVMDGSCRCPRHVR